MAAPLQLSVLGPPRLTRAGQPIRFRTRKQLAVLTYLHLDGRERAVPRDGLVELFWPRVERDRARHSLSQALLAIRGHLGTDSLTRRAQDVRLLAHLSSDLEELKGGNRALPPVLDPLLGLDDCAGAEFAHWVDRARARLRGEAREALRLAIRAARAQGKVSQAHVLAAALHDIDPLCADALYALAERALLDGDQVTAVRLLGEHMRRARAELGANPNPEIAQLLRRLERGEGLPVRTQSSALPAGAMRPEVFVGREVELARLEALWDRTRTAGLQTCLLTGAPGIGKSALLRRFALSLAARTWPAFVVPCQEIGQGIPYAAISDLMLALGKEPRAGGTDPAWLAEGSRVCPALRGVYPGVPQPPEAPTDSIRLRVAEAVLRMMEAVSDGAPLLIAFDDLQFMDPASREVLFLVTRRLEQIPTLILAGTRAGVTDVAEHGGAGLTWGGVMELAPLDPAQTAQLVRDLAGDDPVDGRIRDTIVRLAAGNPYYVEMLLSDWKRHQANSLVGAESAGVPPIVTWSPPENLRAAFAREYAGMSADAQHLLQLLAVAGRAMAAAEAAEILGLEGRGVDRASLELLDRRVVRVERGGLAFKNEMHRAYVYYAMGEERRSYFHARVANWLSAATKTADFQRILEASHHYIGAGMPAEACQSALGGAELAVRKGAPREAERALAALLRSYPQEPASRVHLVLASALITQEKFREAIEALDRWEPTLPLTAADTARVAQLRAEALHRGRLADDDTILQAATCAVDAAEAAGADLVLIRALQVRAEVAAESGVPRDAAWAGTEAERVAEGSASPEAKALASLTGGYCLLVANRFQDAVNTFAAAVPLFKHLGLPFELWRSYNGLGICFTGLARLREAVASFSEALAVARKVGDDVAVSNICNNLGVVYHEAGCFDWAAECYQLPAKLCSLVMPSRHAVPLHTNLARLAMELGDFSESERLTAISLSCARESGSWRLVVIALLQAADLCIARSEPEAAWPHVREAIDLVGDRVLLADHGQFMRLRAHMRWATSGSAPVHNDMTTGAPHTVLLTTPQRLEFEGFAEWVTCVQGGALRQSPALHRLVDHGLFGVLCRLLVVGVGFQGLPLPSQGESIAQLVARVFQPEQRLGLPAVSSLLRPDGV